MARALRNETRQHGSDTVQHAVNVDVDHPGPLVPLQRSERRQRHHAGVVDEDVHAPEPRFRRVCEGGKARRVGHVQCLPCDIVAKLCRQRVQAIGPARADEQASPLAGEFAHGCLADTAGGAADQHGLVDDLVHDGSFPVAVGPHTDAIRSG